MNCPPLGRCPRKHPFGRHSHIVVRWLHLTGRRATSHFRKRTAPPPFLGNNNGEKQKFESKYVDSLLGNLLYIYIS